MLLTFTKALFFVVPLVFGSLIHGSHGASPKVGFEVNFLSKSHKKVKNLSGSGRRSDAPNASDFCE